MGARYEAVHDGVGDGRLADDFMPMLGWQLAGDDGGAAVLALLYDLQEVSAFHVVELGETEIVEDQDIGLGQSVHHFGIGTVCV